LIVRRPVKISASMFCSTWAFSTLTQFGAVGTNQLEVAARANGASAGLLALMPTRDVVLGITPAELVSARIEVVDVNVRIQSTASVRLLLDAGIARSEPPRNVGMYLPFLWLGIGNAPRTGASAGSPIFGSEIRPHSQPFAMSAPTWPCENTVHWLASVPDRFAFESARTVAFSFVRPAIACGELSVPTHRPFLKRAIAPP
jgi:hypothetical protein